MMMMIIIMITMKKSKLKEKRELRVPNLIKEITRKPRNKRTVVAISWVQTLAMTIKCEGYAATGVIVNLFYFLQLNLFQCWLYMSGNHLIKK